MPARISTIINGEEKTHAMVYPGYAARVKIYDYEDDSHDFLLIGCDNGDQSTDIYLVPDSEETSQQETRELVELCTDEDMLDQIDHGDEFYIDTHTPSGDLVRFVIDHSFTMSNN